MIRRAGLWWDSEAEYADAVSAALAAEDDETGAPCPHCNDTAPHAYHRDRGSYCTKAPPMKSRTAA